MNLIADFIEANLDVLVRRFAEATRGLESTQGLKPSEILSTLPEYLHAVAAICRHGATPEQLETRARLEEAHIHLRLRVGATQEDATDEYTLLGRLIPQLWEDVRPEHKPGAADLQCLFQQLEEAMDHVVVLFSGQSLEDRQREKRFLHQMDALAPRSLEPGADLQGPLKPLVELIVRALGATGAELFLVDEGGRRMVPVAHTEHRVPPPGRWVDSRGPSFLGQVARSEEPRVLAQARGLEDAALDGLHVPGWSTLLGLRLWPHGDLMGVLCVGFAEARPVPPRAKRFLETLVEYLAGILDRALLTGQLRETATRLEASESRYRLASQAAADTVWDWNLLTQEVAWSGETRRLLGFAPEETGPLANWWVERIHPEDRGRVARGIHAAIQGTQARWQDEYRFFNREGDAVRVLDTGVILRDATGRGVRMVGAMQDVSLQREEESGRARLLLEARTARVQADTALGHLHVLLQKAPVALAILRGPEHVVELANDCVCQLWGRASDQVLGRPLFNVLTEVKGQGFRELLDNVLTTGNPYVGHEHHARLARAPGGALEDTYFNFVYQPLHEAEVGLQGILIVASEVTEAVRARQRAEGLAGTLHASEERLRLALDAADMGCWDIELTTGRGTWDARFRAMLGLPAQGEVTLDEAMRFVLEEDRSKVEQAMAEAARPGGSGEYACEFRARAARGGQPGRWLSGRGHVHFGPDGRPVRFVGTGLDVTDRKLAEEAARQRAEFEQYLVGIVSHDLRNPLNSIMLGTASLLRREELSERETKAVLRIQASAERAVRMIRDLLDFTQARLGGGLPVHCQDLELGALVHQVVEEARMSAPERDIALSLPQAGLRGCWDPDRVTQLLINLLGNALKYSPEDTPVAVRLREVPGSVLLEVHNGGAPIASDVLPRIFQPMQRGAPGVDAATRSVGLGLYIVRTIVQAHGGTIDVTSTREAGTTFTVRLPHVDAKQAAGT
ncbi:bacteriophytochrome [Corallococcus coralloides]|uniref:histidine kinase n=1 Tax=Corallococcus coralloides TaxID=184914 RepID=A0A410S3H6_CORCK|nr:PAS domain-containing protein [Corallococcus coralloides]QAT88693.1 bacteriophytochrome [Corallococcus coralloides]